MTLKQARVGINATQAEVAKEMGIHVQTYAMLEKCPSKMTIDQAMKFCEIVKQPFDAISFNHNSN